MTTPENPMRIASPRTYRDAINALNTLQSNFASIEAIKLQKLSSRARSEFSLNEVYEYIRRLGYQPHDFNRLNVVHVTGTKGKGSTCAFTESILSQYRKAGTISKIGLFTSPHLKSVRERIRINGAPITELKFTKYFYEVWDKLTTTTSDPDQFPTLQPCDTVKPMYFKYLTVLSFHVFMSEGVDTAIYEVGVGGKYDSTNVVEKPTVTGITSLGIDHTLMLGDTIELIAWNKAGIMKKDAPAIVAEQLEYPESLKTVENEANQIGVASFEVVMADLIPRDIKLGLAGDFQRQNAAVAVKLAEKHLVSLGVQGIDIDENGLPDEFVEGLEKARWDGRCQIIADKKDYDHITWYIDGAHTMESINVASGWFKQEVSKRNTTKILLFNQQSRENAAALLEKLYRNVVDSSLKFDHVIFTTNITWSDGSYNSDLVSMNNSKDQIDRLVVQKELAGKWSQLDQESGFTARKHVFPDIETSLRFTKSLTSDKEAEVFVCGSLHLVGGFLAVLDGDRD